MAREEDNVALQARGVPVGVQVWPELCPIFSDLD